MTENNNIVQCRYKQQLTSFSFLWICDSWKSFMESSEKRVECLNISDTWN